jgi:hypothetical protein
MSDTQVYYARSAYSDPQNIASAITLILAILALPEVAALIPAKYVPAILAVSSVVNLFLRTAVTVRPVANVAPGQTKPVLVPTLPTTPERV